MLMSPERMWLTSLGSSPPTWPRSAQMKRCVAKEACSVTDHGSLSTLTPPRKCEDIFIQCRSDRLSSDSGMTKWLRDCMFWTILIPSFKIGIMDWKNYLHRLEDAVEKRQDKPLQQHTYSATHLFICQEPDLSSNSFLHKTRQIIILCKF